MYGPYAKGKVLMQVLAKAPGSFNRVSQIFLILPYSAGSLLIPLLNDICKKCKPGKRSFEEMAQIYSMGGEGITKGDLGWIAVGALFHHLKKNLQKEKREMSLKYGPRTDFISSGNPKIQNRIMDMH